jgi:hypothetical protein
MAKTTEKNLASLLACLGHVTPNAAPYSELSLETDKYSITRKKVFKNFKVVEKEAIEVTKIEEALARHLDHYKRSMEEIRKLDGDSAERKG